MEKDIDEVIVKEIKDGRIFGLKRWSGKTVIVLIPHKSKILERRYEG